LTQLLFLADRDIVYCWPYFEASLCRTFSCPPL